MVSKNIWMFNDMVEKIFFVTESKMKSFLSQSTKELGPGLIAKEVTEVEKESIFSWGRSCLHVAKSKQIFKLYFLILS